MEADLGVEVVINALAMTGIARLELGLHACRTGSRHSASLPSVTSGSRLRASSVSPRKRRKIISLLRRLDQRLLF